MVDSEEKTAKSYSGKRVDVAEVQFLLGRRVGRALFFPLFALYLELLLHVSTGLSLGYFPIWCLFSLAGGGVLTVLTMPFSKKVNSVLAKILAFAVSLLYLAELIAKRILTNFYPFSALGVAAENRLTDYWDVIGTTLLRTVPILLLMLLPAVLLCILGSRVLLFDRVDIRWTALAGAAVLLFHVLGLLTLRLPWQGDLTPSQLYQADTNLDDQVEQLGLLTMLRRDVVHQFVPAEHILSGGFEPFPSPEVSATPSPTPTPTATPSPPEMPPSPTPTIDTSPNGMDVDLAALAETAPNEDIRWLAQYFGSKEPTRKNAYTGMFQGYNVIFLTLEGFSGYAISEELTPTLYKLTHEGFVFKNFYSALHFTSTSGGECQNLLGLYPKNGNPITMRRTGVLGTNCYFSLAQQLGRLGYTNLGYHANGDMYGRLASHTNLGYDWRQSGSGLELERDNGGNARWPQRDEYLVEATVEDYIHSDTPFHIYYLTISGHMPYSNHWIAHKYRDLTDALPYSDTTKSYVSSCIEVDRALETLIDKLREAGKLENTVIAAAPDHVPYFDVDILEELAGKEFGPAGELENLNERNMDMDVYRNSLILWSASMEEPVYVDKVCGQVDILPTLSNLLGLEYDSRMLSGSDILSDSEGQVIFSSRSWMTDRGFYNRYTQTFTPAEGVEMTREERAEYVAQMKDQLNNTLGCTSLIVENDFYSRIFSEERSGKEWK